MSPAGRYATIGISIIDSTGPEPVIHGRTWPIPADAADQFAALYTVVLGQPDEVIADAGKLQVADEAAVLVQAVVTYGKKGIFTLRITVAPFKNGDSSQVTVAAIASSRPPAADPIQAVFYAGDDGNLLADDPRMEPMFGQVARPDARLGSAR